MNTNDMILHAAKGALLMNLSDLKPEGQMERIAWAVHAFIDVMKELDGEVLEQAALEIVADAQDIKCPGCKRHGELLSEMLLSELSCRSTSEVEHNR